MFEKVTDKVKRPRVRTFTAIILVMVISLLAISEFKAVTSDSDSGEYGLFNPFTLDLMQVQDQSGGSDSSTLTLLAAQTAETSTSGRPWIRIPYRPSLRNPCRPPL